MVLNWQPGRAGRMFPQRRMMNEATRNGPLVPQVGVAVALLRHVVLRNAQ